MRAVLSVAPHPDDELLGAPATLMALSDAGWRVVNLACSLGRPEDADRRGAELREACRRAGCELTFPEPMPRIGRDDDLELAQRSLAQAIARATREQGAELILGPSPHDVHHGHEVVGRAIRDAVEGRGGPRGPKGPPAGERLQAPTRERPRAPTRERVPAPMAVMFWGLWGELPLPNVLHPFSAARLDEIQRALAAHAGELTRARVDQGLEARARVAAVLGAERVFGFGTEATGEDYAELLTAAAWRPGEGWRLAPAARFDPDQPVRPGDGPDIGWWLHAPSMRSQMRGDRRSTSQSRRRGD